VRKSKGFVYFIDTEDGSAVKIGFSKNPRERLKSLQTAIPIKLSLRGFICGSYQDENRWKRELKEFIRQGEWFTRSPEVELRITKALAESNMLNVDTTKIIARTPRKYSNMVQSRLPDTEDISRLPYWQPISRCESKIVRDYLDSIGISQQDTLGKSHPVWIRYTLVPGSRTNLKVLAIGPTNDSVKPPEDDKNYPLRWVKLRNGGRPKGKGENE
jgi:hypothetical protein